MTASEAHNDDFSWLPEPPLRRFELMPGEKSVMRAKPRQSVSEWAQGERYVHVSPLPGPWDNAVVPYGKGIMNFFSAEHVREIFIAGGPQTAKTDISHNCIGWAAVHDPGPTLLTMQDRDTGTDTISDRFIPMLQDTPSLRDLLTGNADDISLKRSRLKNGMTLYLAWSNSEGRLASKPMRFLHLSEVDLYPPAAIKKARARTSAFSGMEKIIEECTVSTEDGRIWSARKLAQACFDFVCVCPHCGHEQTMDPAQVQFKEGAVEPADIVRKEDAWYLCTECNKKWDEEDRNDAVAAGAAIHDPPMIYHGWRRHPGKAEISGPESAWLHLPPLISPFVEFRKIAKAYLSTLVESTQENLVNYYNDCCGLPVPEDAEGEMPQERELYERRSDYAPDGADWQIPMAAVVLTADVDVQGNRVEVEVVAWGPGHESWGIEYKVFHGKPQQQKVWDDLHEWAQTATWRHESGAELSLVKLGIDIGYATDEVSLFVRRSRKYIAHKGSKTRGLPLVPRKPSKTRKYKVPFYELGTDSGKDTLFSWLTVEDPGPRYCHFPTGYDFEYFRMLCSEHPVKEKDRKTGRLITVWKVRKGYKRNEAVDIRVGNMAVRAILNPNYEKLTQKLLGQSTDKPSGHKPQPVVTVTTNPSAKAGTRSRPSWFNRR